MMLYTGLLNKESKKKKKEREKTKEKSFSGLPWDSWNLCFFAIPYLYHKWYLEPMWLSKLDFQLPFSGSLDSYVQFIYSVACLTSLCIYWGSLQTEQDKTKPSQFSCPLNPFTNPVLLWDFPLSVNGTTNHILAYTKNLGVILDSSDPFLHIYSWTRPAYFTSKVYPESISFFSHELLTTIQLTPFPAYTTEIPF